MHSQLRRLFGVFTIGIVLSLSHLGPAQATDPIDPATQPHLKSWSNVIPTAKRFVVLADFNNEAVLDRETGLVWERAPDPTPRPWGPGIGSSFDATSYCVNKVVGGTAGWRLPSVVELKSLQDPSLPSPFVPLNVFTVVPTALAYWTATTSVVEPVAAWFVRFLDGLVSTTNKTNQVPAWCVRGSMNADGY